MPDGSYFLHSGTSHLCIPNRAKRAYNLPFLPSLIPPVPHYHTTIIVLFTQPLIKVLFTQLLVKVLFTQLLVIVVFTQPLIIVLLTQLLVIVVFTQPHILILISQHSFAILVAFWQKPSIAINTQNEIDSTPQEMRVASVSSNKLPCCAGNSCSKLNPEVKQHCISIALG